MLESHERGTTHIMYKVHKEDLDNLIYGIQDAVEFFEDNPTIVVQGNYVLLELNLIRKRMAAIEYFNNEELSFVINRDNFDDLADCVLKAYSKEQITPEEEPEFKNEEDRQTWLKIQKAKRRREAKESITLKDMLDVVLHSGTTSYTYESIVKLTYPQLINSYKIVMNIESFNFMTCFLGMGVDTKEMDLTHWSEKIRQN